MANTIKKTDVNPMVLFLFFMTTCLMAEELKWDCATIRFSASNKGYPTEIQAKLEDDTSHLALLRVFFKDGRNCEVPAQALQGLYQTSLSTLQVLMYEAPKDSKHFGIKLHFGSNERPTPGFVDTRPYVVFEFDQETFIGRSNGRIKPDGSGTEETLLWQKGKLVPFRPVTPNAPDARPDFDPR